MNNRGLDFSTVEEEEKALNSASEARYYMLQERLTPLKKQIVTEEERVAKERAFENMTAVERKEFERNAQEWAANNPDAMAGRYGNETDADTPADGDAS